MKATFEGSIKIKRIRKNLLKSTFYSISQCNKNRSFLVRNDDASRTQGVCHMIYIFLISSLGKA